MNYEIGHETWGMDHWADGECPRCHRMKALGQCEDGCHMCQSCFHKIHDLGPLPSDTMNL